MSKQDRLSTVEQAAVIVALFMHCKKGEDGFAAYEEGWDDERIRVEVSRQVGRDISIYAIRHRRAPLYGRINKPSQPATQDDDRISKMEDRIAALEALMKPRMVA